MRIEDLKTLKEQVMENKIDAESALEILYGNNKKSWHTIEWRNLRSKIIKESCEQCGGTETLTIQHNFHPRNYGEIKKQISIKYGDIIRSTYKVNDLVDDDEVIIYFNNNVLKDEKLVCSECYSTSLLTRKTILPKYRCNRCNTTFEYPIKMTIPVFLDDRIENLNERTNVLTHSYLKLKLYKDKCKVLKYKLYGEVIEKESIIIAIDENIRYLSFNDTITLCKKCAFLYDKKGLDLCPICKKKYKKIHNDMCIDCRGISVELKEFRYD